MLTHDENGLVRQAAIKALARLGNVTSVSTLASALKEGGAISSEASRTLVELRGEGVADELIKQAQLGNPTVTEGMLKVLAERGQIEALPLFRKALTDEDAKVRRAALKTIAALGTQEDLQQMVHLFVTRKDDADRE